LKQLFSKKLNLKEREDFRRDRSGILIKTKKSGHEKEIWQKKIVCGKNNVIIILIRFTFSLLMPIKKKNLFVSWF